jgi:hypothetical protein
MKMKSLARIMKAAVLGSVIAALCLAGFASDKVADNAKMYQAGLEAMKGQEYPKILAKLAEWKFELGNEWMMETPASKDFAEHNRGKTKFSKKEIAEIFDQAGKYKIEVYGLLVGTDSVTMGTINSAGMSAGMDNTVNLKSYTVIRVVFNEDKLANVRTWPKLESSTITGGSWRIR